MVSPGYSAVQREKALAEDTRRRECPHDVVGLHAHKGTMWMSNDGVPLKNVESPYGGRVGPEATEPLVLLVLDHADPVGQHAAIQNVTSMLEHLPAQPEPSLGGGRGDRISDREQTARQVPDTTMDSQLMEGITHLEHLALRVSLDSGPMEGTSCLKPLEQSILQSSWIARPCNGVIKQKSEWKPVITPASSYTLDSRPMEGITYLERPALGVSLDSGPTEGASCPEPLEQSVLDSSLATRPIGCVIGNVFDWEPLRIPATSYTLDSRFMEGTTNLERTALGVYDLMKVLRRKCQIGSR